MQQDAEECWTNILASLRDKLKVAAGARLGWAGWAYQVQVDAAHRRFSSWVQARLERVLRWTDLGGRYARAMLTEACQPACPCNPLPPCRTRQSCHTLARGPAHPAPPTRSAPLSQDGPSGSSGDPVIRKLFGVKLHKSLKAEEGEETIEVGAGSRRHMAHAWQSRGGDDREVETSGPGVGIPMAPCPGSCFPGHLAAELGAQDCAAPSCLRCPLAAPFAPRAPEVCA